jgi:tRNAThr (cytosine32-N3)-methyltransferase
MWGKKNLPSVHGTMAIFALFLGFLNVVVHRFLTEEDDVWSQNAWDHVPPPDDQLEKITESLSKQRLKPVPQDEKEKYNSKPAKHWYIPFTIFIVTCIEINKNLVRDNFYKMNASNFFRNRKWYDGL